MNNRNNKIRTVSVNDRGQIVIPEDIRKDMGIVADTTLVVIERGGELVIKKESDVIHALSEDLFWKGHVRKSLENSWNKEDVIWDKIAKEDLDE